MKNNCGCYLVKYSLSIIVVDSLYGSGLSYVMLVFVCITKLDVRQQNGIRRKYMQKSLMA